MNRLPSLAHLFSTNAPVKPEERLVLAQEVEVLDRTIEELRQRLHALARDREDCIAVLSSIRTMPAEILARVFAFTIDSRQIQQNEDVRKQVIDLCLVYRI